MAKKFTFNNKINRKFFVAIFLCSTLLSIGSTILQLYENFQDGVLRLEQRFENINSSFTQSISSSLWDFNIKLVQQQIIGIHHLPDIRYVEVTTNMGKVYFVGDKIENPTKSAVYPFTFDGDKIGEMLILADYSDIYNYLWQTATFIIFTEFIKIFIVALCSFIIVHQLISRHLYQITLFSKSMSSDNLDDSLILLNRSKRRDELDDLVDAINGMRQTLKNEIFKLKDAEHALLILNSELESKVEERTAKLADSHQQLQASFEELTLTKDQLVQSEKMASLGQLVAGVAHEVNTPLGICVTSISALKETMQELENSLSRDRLSKKQLVSTLKLFWEYEQIIEKSLDKSVELIRGFKSVAVDQQIDEILNINLNKHVQDIVNAVKTLFKQKKYDIIIKLDPKLTLDTYPSAWNQILTNLLTNSHIHGFEDRMHGTISLDFSVQDSNLVLIYQDDGKGLDPKIRDKVFDPFVTTKRGQGGSGLGMNIVYNLVNSKLGGTIDVKDIKQGCCFVLTVPLK